jgi:D-3-phosphoglycerate dehydrogenase / 2-oxoglutarate reductase
MTPRILVSEPGDFPTAALEVLAEVGEVVLADVSGPSLRVAFDEHDAVLVRLATKINAEILGDHPRCRVLGVPTTGLDHVDLEACAARGIAVISLRGELEFLRTIRATAEHTISLILALLRNLVPATRSVHDGRWARDDFRGREISGRTIGILGMGRLGTMVAELLLAMGANVVGYDVRHDWAVPGAAQATNLDDLLQRSSVLSVHVPYSPGDRPVVGATELALLPSGSYLVNTSRGGVIDDAALLTALRSGHLAGAALDVLQGEPDIAANPLIDHVREHDNLLITPHIGGNTYESLERVEVFIARKVVEALGVAVEDQRDWK